MSRFRSTSVHIDDEGPQRWDREKFEQYRTRGPAPRDPYDDRERFAAPPPPRTTVAVEERFDRRGSRGPRYEDDRYLEEERYTGPSRRRMDFMEEPIPAEVANRALAPYRRPQYAEAPVRRPARPQFIRRQSSLDTFDRKPMSRYGEEYRLPADLPIPLPIRRPAPPRSQYREEFEDISYRDLPSRERERGYDEYRDIRIRREHHGRAPSKAAQSVRSASSSESSFEEVNVPEPPKIGKRGKTRMPKRLVHKQAIVDMGLPFEEEDDFFIVQRALTKVHIDEVIEKSKTLNSEKTVFKYTEEKETEKEEVKEEVEEEKEESVSGRSEYITRKTTVIEGLPPPPPMSMHGDPPPPPKSVRLPSPTRTEKSYRTARPARSHYEEEYREEVIEHSNPIGGPLTVLAPQNRQTEDDIRREIRNLEAERKALKLEREADLVRRGGVETDYELVERVDRWDETRSPRRARSKSVVRIEKDRKGRMALVRSTH